MKLKEFFWFLSPQSGFAGGLIVGTLMIALFSLALALVLM
jgi:hypothetical protein